MNRRSAGSAAAPPLWTWPLAVLLVTVVFIVTLDDYLDDAATSRQVFESAQRKRIAAFARQRAAQPEALHIVLLGDSSLRNATFFDAEMDRSVREHGGPATHFLRIVVPSGSLHDFVGLFRDILAAQPDLLIVQSWLLPVRSSTKQRSWHRAYREGKPFDHGRSRKRHRERLLSGDRMVEHQTWIFDRVVARAAGRLRVESGLGRRFEAQRRGLFCNPGRGDELLQRRARRYPPGGSYDVDPAAATTVDLLLAQAAEVGATLVFLDVPVTSQIAEMPGIQQKAARQRSYFALHASHPNFGHWRFEQPLPDAEFCDPVHMSRSGRRSYQGWLARRLQAFAEERSTP